MEYVILHAPIMSTSGLRLLIESLKQLFHSAELDDLKELKGNVYQDVAVLFAKSGDYSK